MVMHKLKLIALTSMTFALAACSGALSIGSGPGDSTGPHDPKGQASSARNTLPAGARLTGSGCALAPSQSPEVRLQPIHLTNWSIHCASISIEWDTATTEVGDTRPQPKNDGRQSSNSGVGPDMIAVNNSIEGQIIALGAKIERIDDEMNKKIKELTNPKPPPEKR